jgi:hypothetical protein
MRTPLWVGFINSAFYPTLLLPIQFEYLHPEIEVAKGVQQMLGHSHPTLAGVLVETAPAGSDPTRLVDCRLELRLRPVDHVPGVGHIISVLGLDVLFKPGRIIAIVTHIGCDGLIQGGVLPAAGDVFLDHSGGKPLAGQRDPYRQPDQQRHSQQDLLHSCLHCVYRVIYDSDQRVRSGCQPE